MRSRAEALPTGEVRVRIRWGDYPLCERRLARGVEFTLGEEAADLALPASLIGADRLVLVEARGRAPRVALLPDAEVEIAEGVEPVECNAANGPGARAARLLVAADARVVQRVRGLTLEVSREAPLRLPAPPRRWPWRGLGFALGSAALHAGLLLGMARAVPPTELEQQQARLVLLRYYLRSSLATEPEPLEPGTGRRAQGEEGAMGSARIDSVNRRFSVQGPRDNPDPHLARAAALEEASVFGMIGLLAAGAAADPGAPTSPRGRDTSLGQERASAAPRHGRDQGRFAAREGGPEGALRLDAPGEPFGAEEFSDHGVNPAQDPRLDPLSTFAVDVDTGSYGIAKRKLNEGELPPFATVRAEEFINAFDYAYAAPEAGEPSPFRIHLEAAPSPHDAGHHLVRIGIQGRRVPAGQRPPLHLVALVDSSGSMNGPDRMDLVKESLRLLVEQLRPGDTLALATYAGRTREVLPPTGPARKAALLAAIDQLDARGSTAMASGIELAYRLAARTRRRGHVSRVLVLSDGDANVGERSPDAILARIADERAQGVALSTVGFGTGNYRDAMMERLADAGDGNYSYVGSSSDAQRVFVGQAAGMLQTIARDVKVQVEFDPEQVVRYRLVGYENRDVADEDFRDDAVDGGEIGAGHSVTAIYDVVFRRLELAPIVVRVRSKAIDTDAVAETEAALGAWQIAARYADASESFRLAATVAGFAESLRGSAHGARLHLADLEREASSLAGDDPDRGELARLITRARALRGGGT